MESDRDVDGMYAEYVYLKMMDLIRQDRQVSLQMADKTAYHVSRGDGCIYLYYLGNGSFTRNEVSDVSLDDEELFFANAHKIVTSIRCECIDNIADLGPTQLTK